MIISQSVFGALCSIKHSDLELYLTAISLFDMTGFINSGSYSRCLISFESNKCVENSITVIRVIRKGNLSRRTHAILPDIIIPYSPYSVRFVISMIYKYNHRNCSASKFCESFGIPRSTLSNWIKLHSAHISEYISHLKEADRILRDKESAAFSIENFPNVFFNTTGHPFLISCHIHICAMTTYPP